MRKPLNVRRLGALFLIGLAGCGSGSSSSPPPIPVTVSVRPASVTVPTGQPQAFVATVTGSPDTAVTWQINGVTGGNATVGTISRSGVYTAPAAIPLPATVTVAAIAVADSTKSASASVMITVTVSASVASTGTGRLQTFMSTNFGPGDAFTSQFFNRVTNGAPLLTSLQPQHVRILLNPGVVPQRSPTTWDFSLLDLTVQPLLNAADQSPQFEIARAPAYMNGASGSLLPANYAAFAAYAANLVRYYNAGGFDANGAHYQSPSPKHIQWWSIYNEPNFFFTPAQYVALYNEVVPAMLAVDPSIRFVAVQLGDLGGTGRSDWPQVFMPEFVSGVTARVDAVATHLYATCEQSDTDQMLFDSATQFAAHVQTIATSLKSNAALATVPVWATENNVNANFDGEGGVAGFTTCNGVMLPYIEDHRGSSAFFAAWRPLVFSQLAKAGAQALYHWFFPAGFQYGEYDDNDPPGTEKLLLSYWVDYELAHYFPSPPGADRLQVAAADPAVEILAARNSDGSVVIMAVDHAVHAPADNNGAGDPRLVSIDVSALGHFSVGTVLTVDALTDPVNGPTAIEISPAASMQVSLGGYGVAFLTLQP